MKKILASGHWIATAALLALPLAAEAQAPTVLEIFNNLRTLFGYALVIIFSIAALYFLFGVMQYIFSAGDETTQKKAKQHILYGIVGMAIMVAFWALILVITNYFGLGQRAAPTLPSLPAPTNIQQ